MTATVARRTRVLEAMTYLGLARIAVRAIPFRVIVRWIGARPSESSREISESHARHARQINAAVRGATRRAPFEASCLPQALAAKAMLACRGVPSTLYLGVRKHAGSVEAHAWLRAGTTIVTGAPGHEAFSQVGAFS